MGEKLDLKDVMSVCVTLEVIFHLSWRLESDSFDCRERSWWPTPGLWSLILRGILSENSDGNH